MAIDRDGGKDRPERLLRIVRAHHCSSASIALLAAIAVVMIVLEPVARQTARAAVIDGHYVVVYNNREVNSAAKITAARANQLGFDPSYIYGHVLKGFAAKLDARQVRALRADPAVDFVSKDRTVHATSWVPLAPSEPTPPSGVRRILGATTTQVRQASGVNVAVIDSGIQLNHPDLNAVTGTDCVDPGTPPDDGFGHGTHVAGTIGAENNGFGVTGVAPGTKEYAVRVLDNTGSGSTASVVCGIDWVTANASSQNIRVANMSLAGNGPSMGTQSCATTTDAERKAICKSTAAGVDYVVAAGNGPRDFDNASSPSIPAAYPEVLTATAVADSDGASGGGGPSSSCSWALPDDTPASFSNYAATAAGQAHTIAAPGVCIESTVPVSSYSSNFSGTSMAAPHISGVVALCVNESGVDGPCASMTPAQTITYLRSDAQTYNNANPNYGFTNDPISNPIAGVYYGFLTRVPPPPVSIPTAPAGSVAGSTSQTGRRAAALQKCKHKHGGARAKCRRKAHKLPA